jgi:hypothetical protein
MRASLAPIAPSAAQAGGPALAGRREERRGTCRLAARNLKERLEDMELGSVTFLTGEFLSRMDIT